MPDRIVVCLGEAANRTPIKGEEGFLVYARDLMLRAKAFGATLCTWSWGSLSFSFQVDDLEEAAGFVTGTDARKLVHRFGVGISQGSLELLTNDGEMELGWGLVLQKAMLLSQLAKSGEVLVDCDMLSVHHVQLVTRGTRTSQGTPRVRAYLLAVDDPFRAEAERTVERLVEPPLLGRDAALETLAVAPGTLATVRATSGLGGTRLLRALAARESRSICLLLQPSCHRMEPLGSLRRAMARAQALGNVPELSKDHDATRRRLAEGRGAAPAAVADLLEAWLAGGLLLIDDAIEIDSATLDVVATALLGAEYPFRAVARLDRDSPLPAELAPLPPGAELDLEALSDDDAKKLVMAWTGGIMKDEEAGSWAARGGGVPLALGEALADGLSSGALTWGEQGARPRSVPALPPSPMTAAGFILKRLRFLTPGSRAVLHALATLGGDAPTLHIAKLIESAADIPIDLVLEQDRLTKSGWLRAPEPGWLALPSRTHLRMIDQSMPDTRRAAWHRVASTVAEASGSLELAEAAWHAVAANDRPRAQRLAIRAAALAEAAGLESAARDLNAFARAHDPAPRPRIESDPSGLIPRPPMGSSPGDPEDIFPVALAARGPKRPSRFTFPPVDVPEGGLLSEPPPVRSSNTSEPPSLRDSDLLPPSIPSDANVDDPVVAQVLGPEDIRRTLPDTEDHALPAPPRVPRLKNHPPIRRPTPPGSIRRPTLELLIDDDEDALPLQAKKAIEDVPPPPSSILQPPPRAVAESEPPTVRQASPREAMPSIHELTADDAIGMISSLEILADTEGPGSIDEGPDSERTLVDESPKRQESSEHFAGVVRILRSGNAEELKAWAAQTMREAPEHRHLAERVGALAELRLGNQVDAVRVLRNACEHARTWPAIERSRSHLAYGLGLAEVGRTLEALVEGLEALARAREAGDGKAERACLAFLRKLYANRGQDSIDAWQPRST